MSLRKLVSTILICAAASALNVQAAAQDSVYGIVIGEPLVLPACPVRWVNSLKMEADSQEVCKTEAHAWREYKLPVTPVVFPIDTAPLLMKGRTLRVLEHEGKVISAEFLTRGASSQDYVYSELVKKYGKPRYLSNDLMYNGYGATFPCITAEWRTKRTVVRFRGVNGETSEGIVTVDTEASERLKSAWSREEKAKRPAL